MRDLLADPERTGYVAVALPEEMPVNETLELERRLPEAVGVGLEAIVVNGMWPERFSAADAEALRAAPTAGPTARRGPRSPPTSARAPSAATCGASGARRTTHVVTLPYLFESELGLPEYEQLGAQPGAAAVTPRGPGARRPLGLAAWSRRSVWGVARRRLALVAGQLDGALALLARRAARSPASWSASPLVPELRWRRWRWDVRPEAIDIRHGTFTVGARSSRCCASSTSTRRSDIVEQQLEPRRPSSSTPRPGATRSRCSPSDDAGDLRDRIAELARTADEP